MVGPVGPERDDLAARQERLLGFDWRQPDCCSAPSETARVGYRMRKREAALADRDDRAVFLGSSVDDGNPVHETRQVTRICLAGIDGEAHERQPTTT